MINKSFAGMLLDWYDKEKRDFPWRGATDVYKIWLSEIMLQQTRTETVIRYYNAFLQRFPSVFDLAKAEEDEVLKLWEGMGYYSRARNLHKAAKMVVSEMGGVFPKAAAELRKLPGVGPYASCAIASIAYSECVPALDGNQARVLSRILAHDTVIKSPADLWDKALPLVDKHRAGDYNQALMDLGASMCTPKKPDCERCPVQGHCRAFEEGAVELFPMLPTPIVKRDEERTVALVFIGDGVLVRRRPSAGLLGGLWEFPNYEGHLPADELCKCLKGDGVVSAEVVRDLPRAKHVFTHLVWRMIGYALSADDVAGEWTCANLQALDAMAFPTALRKYLEIARADILD